MKKLIIIVFILMSFGTWAVQPSEGLWFDPSESGRGLTVELQNNILVVTYFGYGSDRTDRWWQGVGSEASSNSLVYTGELLAFKGGQCVGCSYQQPTLNESSSLGQFTLTFTSLENATLQWAGGTSHLVKQLWGYGQQKDYVFGSWMFSSFLSNGSSISEEVLGFLETIDDGDGGTILSGNRVGYLGTTDYLALADTVEVDGQERIFILLDSSTSYYLAHVMTFTENKSVGRSWLYRKDETLSGNGLVAVSLKLFDLYEFYDTSNNAKSENNLVDYESINDSIYMSMKKYGETDPLTVDIFNRLATKMEHIKAIRAN